MKKYLANAITSLRILGVCIFFLFMPFGSIESQCLLIPFFVLLCLSDFLDGMIARSRFGCITRFGKIADPSADKLLILVYLPLLEMHVITSLPVFVIMARDIAVTALRLLAPRNSSVGSARWSGKVKATLQFLLAIILMARVSNLSESVHSFFTAIIYESLKIVQSIPQLVIDSSIWFVCIWTIWSMIDYMRASGITFESLFHEKEEDLVSTRGKETATAA